MKNYINVTDYITKNGDVSDILQKIIDENPNRTIFFPDGEYVIDKPICTPAEPTKSVSIKLADFAHIKAGDNWNSDEALIKLGGKDASNNNYTPGSNYGLEGGIIDGCGKANGISIDSGRETYIRNCSVKNTKIGIHIKYGANNGSSDADVLGVNIVCTREKDSIGILVEGWDNTFTNIRIARAFIGVKLCASGNMLRNVHPLYIYGNEEADNAYEESVGFYDCKGNNFYDYCYSDQLATGFYIKESRSSIFQSCFSWYYNPNGKFHRSFCAEGKFNSVVSNFKVGFQPDQKNNILLSEGEEGGNGCIENLYVNSTILSDDTYKKYLKGNTIF